jgi:hypothetical protein
MHPKVFVKLKKYTKNPLFWAKKTKKTPKNKKKQKKPLGWVFFKKTWVFFNPDSFPGFLLIRICIRTAVPVPMFFLSKN